MWLNRSQINIAFMLVAFVGLGFIFVSRGQASGLKGNSGSLVHAHPATAGTHNHGNDPLEARLNAYIEEKTGYPIAGHESGEGPTLSAAPETYESIQFAAQACPANTIIKQYDFAAIPITMVLNRWGDRDPEAFMFALEENIPAIRAQEALMDDEAAYFGLNLGMGDDAIQPLTLRANVGDCVQMTFRNDLADHPVSIAIHGADLVLGDSGEPALTSNPNASALPGSTLTYEWYIDPDYYSENTHYIRAHGAQSRYLVSHGLFGALVIEPAGSEYFDQLTGEPLCQVETTGVERCGSAWGAMISPGDGSADFREFAMFYHEIGNAKFAPVDKDGIPNPIIDPIVESYKPNGRGINYRSESFWRRMYDMEEAVGFADEAEAYGTYTFGEPAMPVPQSYVGDPIKFRLIHGGSETFHVPHLHGGGIQWQRQQDVGKTSLYSADSEYTPIDAGLRKDFPARMPSSGNDSQTIGPSETYELEISCGSGGCQQTVGDFLFHCHVASHYISGMWHFWRVYNTVQDAGNKTDQLPIMAELPDRQGDMKPAVTSAELIGNDVDFAGMETTVTSDNLPDIVEVQLPPQGEPKHVQDAAVWNWGQEGDLYLGEPETELTWANFAADNPGERPALMFDPDTGKLAFPFLRPHLGQRPPFAPNHGPAPYLEPRNHERGEPAPPGSNGEYSLCPEGAPQRTYKIHAIETDIPVTSDMTDEQGMIFVVKEYEELARTDPDFKMPLAIRANQGDCVDIVLVNELETGHSDLDPRKTNIHIHFVQFDTQASDGVISGASYEQAPRPFIDEGQSFVVQERVNAGTSRITLDDTSTFHIGSAIAIGMEQTMDGFETAIIAGIEDNTLIFADPLKYNHDRGQLVSVEYVRYRWYVARQNGAIYFHDHVDALNRWGHGLFGALIAEPRNSTWHDPNTGEEILSGTQANIHVPQSQEVVPGLLGSFREFVMFMNDDNPLTGSSFNLRAEPLTLDTERGQGPPELALSSVPHGDPHTPLLQAYAGDPMMFRLLTSATEEVHPFHITGHRFRWERFQADSPELTTFGVGISERFNAYVAGAGGNAGRSGDYLYYNGAERHFNEGSWGILRVHNQYTHDLRPLPGRMPLPTMLPSSLTANNGDAPRPATTAGFPCPFNAPRRTFDISAITMPLVFNVDAAYRINTGRLYVLDTDVEAVLAGDKQPEPLVIRANAGDCVDIHFTNHMDTQPASLHLDALAVDPRFSLGINVGYNREQTASPGETVHYRYFADKEIGSVLMRDFGNIFRNPREGLYGAMIIEAAGSTYVDPYTGDPLESGVNAVIQHPDQPDFREFVTVFHDADPDIGLFLMPYDEEVNRLVGVNYRAEPLTLRLAEMNVVLDADKFTPNQWVLAQRLFDSETFGDPATNVFESFAGDPVRFRVVSGYSEQNQVFHVEGHQWQISPEIAGSDVVSSRYLPSRGVMNVELLSTGGPQERAGDYLWSNQRLPYEKAGQWGYLRVLDGEAVTGLLPLVD